MHSRLVVLLSLLFMPACARSHTRTSDASLVDASVPADAAEVLDARVPSQCAEGRREWVIPAPFPTRAGFAYRLLEPRVNERGDRVLASTLVVRGGGSGMGISDIRTFALDGSDAHALFLSETPYLAGTSMPFEDSLGSGGFARGRVWGELMRVDQAYFSVQQSDDRIGAPEDARVALPIAAEQGLVGPRFDVARQGQRAVFVDARVGVIAYEMDGGAFTPRPATHLGQAIRGFYFAPRLSPSGRWLAARITQHPGSSAPEGQSVTLIDLDAETETRFDLADLPLITFIAFMNDRTLLMMDASADRSLYALSISDGAISRVDIGLPSVERDHIADAFDVTTNGETFVISEDTGRQLRVVHCDPALLALAGR